RQPTQVLQRLQPRQPRVSDSAADQMQVPQVGERRQVGQPRVTYVLADAVLHLADVADRLPRQQPPDGSLRTSLFLVMGAGPAEAAVQRQRPELLQPLEPAQARVG